MSIPRILGGLALATVVALSAAPAITADAAPVAAASEGSAHSAPGLPQAARAREGSTWLVAQLVHTTGGDYLPGETKGSVDLSGTSQAVLALASTDSFPGKAQEMLRYLEGHVNALVRSSGADDPGSLAFLIMDAHAYGLDPRSFGGTDLVSRLLATMRRSGRDIGLFGSQSPTYTGAYNQGLSLAALRAAGVTGAQVSPAVAWLQHQECANGTWMAYRRNLSVPCPASDPAQYSGPDTNSTALAVEGLVAQGKKVPATVTAYYRELQAPIGGWGEYGGAADPDSTALVLQSLRATATPFSAMRLDGPVKNPVSALLGFQFRSGAAEGAFWFPSPPSAPTPNVLATIQAVTALGGKALPFIRPSS